MKYIVANWKANKTVEDGMQWMKIFMSRLTGSPDVTVIIAPQYPLLVPLFPLILPQKNVFLATQDISAFEHGSHTGEVSAQAVVPFARYAIIGHSERRNLYHEPDTRLADKCAAALKNRIEPLYCIRNASDPIPGKVKIVVYEPEASIGSGKNEAVESVLAVKKQLQLPESSSFLYGGSVNPQNIKSYLESGSIDGFLVGGSSLDPISFSLLVEAVVRT